MRHAWLPPCGGRAVIDAKGQHDAPVMSSGQAGQGLGVPPQGDVAAGLSPHAQVVGCDVMACLPFRGGQASHPSLTGFITRARYVAVADKTDSHTGMIGMAEDKKPCWKREAFPYFPILFSYGSVAEQIMNKGWNTGMRAGIMPWVGCGILLAPLAAMAEQATCHVPPATVGCTQAITLQRVGSLSPAAMSSGRTLIQMHCRRVDGTGNWQVLGHHGDAVLLRHLPIQKGEGALYFPAAVLHPVAGHLPSRPSGLLRLVMAGVGAVLLWPLLRYGWRLLRRRQAWRVCRRLVFRHADALRIRRRQLVQVNSYGVERTARWQREQTEFIRTIIKPALLDHRLQWAWPAIADRVLARIGNVASQKLSGEKAGQATGGYTPDMDPIGYERYCADRLRACGWDAHATPPGGDQGADVIATRGGKRLVVQCKLYRNAVGNEAVQQISAARLHYHADIAAVVSNADYTTSARQLARSNKVFLLHHDELPAFAARLARERKKA